MRTRLFLSVILMLGLTVFPLSASPLTISNADFLQLVTAVETVTEVSDSLNTDLGMINERIALLESELGDQRSATSRVIFRSVVVSVVCSLAIAVPLAIVIGGNR